MGQPGTCTLGRCAATAAFAALLTLAGAPSGLASVSDMRALVAERPELVHHWTFEGTYARECLRDKQLGMQLRAVSVPGLAATDALPMLAGPGPDATSRCLCVFRDDEKRGRVAQTVGLVRFEREGTVELLLRADTVPPGEFNKGWVLFAGSQDAGRVYPAGVSHFREAQEIIAGFGTGNPFHEKAEVVIARDDRGPSFHTGAWHYLAVTYSHSRRTGDFVVNAYIGPVEGGELTHSVKNEQRPGNRTIVGDRAVFLGCATSQDQILAGEIDEVALYDRALSPDVLDQHFAALKEPADPEDTANLPLSPAAPIFQVSKALEERHADAYTNEWQHTSPDLVVFIPEDKTGPETDNQHFIVFPLKNGDFVALWTSAYRESHPNQHIVFSQSTDQGLTWSEPVTIAGPTITEEEGQTKYEGLASWAFPIYVPAKNRIYVFYNKSIGVFDPHPGSTGEMRFILTEDDGQTWSREYTLSMRRTAIMAPDPEVPPNWIIWQQPVELDGQIIGCGTVWSSAQLAQQKPDALVGSECWFWRFDNILTEDDPEKIRVTMFPDGDHGIRMPNEPGSKASTAEEPTVVRLSDGRWFCVFRSYRGCAGCAISGDRGHTWSEPDCLRYNDGGDRVLQPTASCPLYPLGDGRYLLTFHNNDGTANGGRHPWDWKYNRTPAFYSVGREMLDREQPVWFTRPIMFLDNEALAWGPTGRTSVAVYTSFFLFGGQRWYWYPDRKHFLLGKFITDEMLAEAEKLR